MSRPSFAGDRGNAQVIGALLLAAEVVFGAVGVGALVFDFDDRYPEEKRPSVSFRVEYDEDAEELTIQHRSGATLRGDRVELVSGGATLGTWSGRPSVSAGDAITIGGVRPDLTVVVYWYDADGDRHELRQWRGPAASS